MTATIKIYSITVDGFGPERFHARSASAARYQAFKALHEAGYRYEFRDFLAKTGTLHLGIERGDPRTPEYGVGT